MDRPEPPTREPVLVSACLLGLACRYDGATAKDEARAAAAAALEALGDAVEVVGICPEETGGLGTPRPAAWLEGGDAAAVLADEARVVTGEGADVTAGFRAGAEAALGLCRELGVRRALLKERSPSCGVTATHRDGVPVPGPGVTARLLADQGIDVQGC